MGYSSRYQAKHGIASSFACFRHAGGKVAYRHTHLVIGKKQLLNNVFFVVFYFVFDF